MSSLKYLRFLWLLPTLLWQFQAQAQNDPDWSVDPGNFQYSMTIIASVRLNNVVSADAQDRIGVFVGEELRGTGFLNINVPSTNTQVAFIQVYSNELSGEILSFRVYDDSEDLLVDAVNTETFQDSKKLGENLEPFEVTDNSLVTDLSLSIESIDENLSSGTLTATLSHNDPDEGQTHTFSLVSGEGDTDNDDFLISGNELTVNARYDYEVTQSVSLRLKVVDSKNGAFEEAITLAINDKNDDPTDIALNGSSVVENSATGTVIGSFTTTDQDENDTHTYNLVAGTGDTDNALFDIVSADLQVNGDLDFETKPSLSIRVSTTDEEGASFEEVFEISLEDGNDAPEGLALSNSTVSENETEDSLVGTLSTTDPDDGDGHSYGFVTGDGDTNNGSFAIRNDNELFATSAFNFEVQSSYQIRLMTTDSEGETFEQNFTITVTDENDSPTDLALSNNSVPEDAAVDDLIGSLSTTDEDVGDTHSYALTPGEGDQGNALFRITGDQLLLAGALDFESASGHSVRVQVTDAAGATFEKVLSINVTDVNDAPSAIGLSASAIDENNALKAVIGNFTTTDPDAGDSHSYALTSGAGDEDNASFEINSSGELLAKAVFDFEQQASYAIRVQSTDTEGATVAQAFTITVNDVNETGTVIALSGNQLPENSASGTNIGSFSTTDEDESETFTYTLVSGTGDADNAAFQITGSTLQSAQVFDHETQSSFSIRVRSTDSQGNEIEDDFSINVTDENEQPAALSLSESILAENAAAGTVIGSLSSTDVDEGDSFVYSFVSGSGSDDNGSFTIQGDDLQAPASFDFEAKSTYTVRIATTDQGGLTAESAFTISITDENDAPTAISLSASSIAENNTVGDAIGDFSTTDEDAGDSHSYVLTSGTGDEDNASFEINSSGELLAKAVFDFEQQASYAIRVQSTDSEGAMVAQAFTITVNDVNETGTVIALSGNQLPENSASGTAIGSFSTTDEDESETFTYTLVSGTGVTDNAAFQITGSTLQSAQVFDHETQSSFSIRVRSTDSQGNEIEDDFSINVTDENEHPAALSLSANSLAENAAAGTVIGSLSTTDVDEGDSFVYSFVSGTGADNNAAFTIQGDALQAPASFDFEAKSSYTVRIATTDQGGLTAESAFTINITDENDAPAAISLSASSIAENNTIGDAIGEFSTTDEDAGDSHSYTLTNGTGDEDNARFEISSGQLMAKAVFDFEQQSNYSIRVSSTDLAGASITSIFTITITDVNEAGTVLALSGNQIDENSPASTPIGTLSTVDPDAGDSYTYSLVAGTGDDDNASFRINGTSLESAAIFDHESQESLSIRVRSTDSQGNALEEVFSITVADVNEDPTAITLSGNRIPENSPGGALIGTLNVTDEDENEDYVFVLKAGVDDNLFFGINGGNQLVVAGELDFENQNSFAISIQAIDSEGRRFDEGYTIAIENVEEPGIGVSSAEFDFGEVGVGESASQELVINNTGPDGVLRVTAVDLPAGFRIDQSTAEVAPGESITLNLFFEPEAVGAVEEVLTISSNAGQVEIGLTGIANLVTSLEDLPDLSQQVTVYPNPARGRITISTSPFYGRPLQITLQSVSGQQTVLSQSENAPEETHLSLAGLTPGLYILVLEGEDKFAKKKLWVR